MTAEQIKSHQAAADLLETIINELIALIKSKKTELTEKKIQDYILNRYREENLITDVDPPIVSFRENTAAPHYYAEKNFRLLPESLIMLDLWAGLRGKNSPMADITWMAYFGQNPSTEILHAFNQVIKARDLAIEFIQTRLARKQLPSGKEIDDIARGYLAANGLADNFLHSTGHPLGIKNPHGAGVSLSPVGIRPLKRGIGYTIEPGVYFDDFGIRSEIDFYVSDEMKMIITTPVQTELTILQD